MLMKEKLTQLRQTEDKEDIAGRSALILEEVARFAVIRGSIDDQEKVLILLSGVTPLHHYIGANLQADGAQNDPYPTGSNSVNNLRTSEKFPELHEAVKRTSIAFQTRGKRKTQYQPKKRNKKSNHSHQNTHGHNPHNYLAYPQRDKRGHMTTDCRSHIEGQP